MSRGLLIGQRGLEKHTSVIGRTEVGQGRSAREQTAMPCGRFSCAMCERSFNECVVSRGLRAVQNVNISKWIKTMDHFESDVEMNVTATKRRKPEHDKENDVTKTISAGDLSP